MKPVLLIVDDEESVRESFRLALQNDYDLIFAEDVKTTLSLLKTKTFNLCLLDIMLPDGSGLDLLRQIKRRDSSIDVIMVTALQGAETGLNAMKGKAQDYITKPFRLTELRGLIQKVLANRASEQKSADLNSEINQSKPLCLMGGSKAAKDLAKKIGAVALGGAPVCLVGEEGSGIEDVAKQIHLKSSRQNGPWVTFNCPMAPSESLERELMGEESPNKLSQIGKMEFAHRGTIFIRQVHRLPLTIQDKLTAIFSDKTIFYSETQTQAPLDVRIILSSDMDLTSPAAEVLFLKDFYEFFIKGRTFSVPALRERKEDIPLLMDQVRKMTNPRAKTPVKTIQADVIELLMEYAWPGNLRELEKSVETMVLFSDKSALTMDDIPLDILMQGMDLAKNKKGIELSLKQVWRQFERKYISKVLAMTLGNQTETAQWLGIHRVTLVEKLKKLSLKKDYRKIVRKRRIRGLGFRHL